MRSFTGVVQMGSRRATKLGYPTINLAAHAGEANAVYVARVVLKDGQSHRAAAFSDVTRGILEAHILDFKGDLYGELATIEVYEKIRDGKKFTTDAELKSAIEADVA
ncbi:riboflavin kinase, partial [Candidatus Kaiserbacteria bacterium]|nr:riboflavin kinase [Candidatus Kaiserbacteria bacterium]